MCGMKLFVHSQTSTVQPLKFHPTLYWACGYLSMLGLKLIHVSKRGPYGVLCVVHYKAGLFSSSVLRWWWVFNMASVTGGRYQCIMLNYHFFFKCGRILWYGVFNTLRPWLNDLHFADDIFKCIFLNENHFVFICISRKYVPMDPIVNMSALVQMMAWRRSGDKPLSEPMVD